MLSRLWLFVTLWIVARQAPLPMEFSRQEYWSGLPFPSPGDLPHLGIEPCSLCFRQILYHLSHQGSLVQFSSVQLLSRVRLSNLLKLMSIESVMPSNHLVLCCPLLLLPSIFPSIRVFSNKSVLHIRWPKYWRFSISPSNEYSGLISFTLGLTGFLSSQSKGLSRVFSNTTVQKHQFFGAQLSSQFNSHMQTWPLEKP